MSGESNGFKFHDAHRSLSSSDRKSRINPLTAVSFQGMLMDIGCWIQSFF